MYRLRPILVAAAALAAAPGLCAPAPPAAAESPAASATAPAQARAAPPADATRIPEPDTIALFVMGAIGLVVGRRLSRSRRRATDD